MTLQTHTPDLREVNNNGFFEYSRRLEVYNRINVQSRVFNDIMKTPPQKEKITERFTMLTGWYLR